MYDLNTTVSVGVSDFDGTLSQIIKGEIDKKDKSRHYKIELFSYEFVDFIDGFRGGVGCRTRVAAKSTLGSENW